MSYQRCQEVGAWQILDISKQVGSTKSDLSQTALTSLATILQDGPPIQVKEKDLKYLLELVSPDLEEQGGHRSPQSNCRTKICGSSNL